MVGKLTWIYRVLLEGLKESVASTTTSAFSLFNTLLGIGTLIRKVAHVPYSTENSIPRLKTGVHCWIRPWGEQLAKMVIRCTQPQVYHKIPRLHKLHPMHYTWYAEVHLDWLKNQMNNDSRRSWTLESTIKETDYSCIRNIRGKILPHQDRNIRLTRLRPRL